MLSRIANTVAIAMSFGLGILVVCVAVFRIYFSALRRSQAHHTNVSKNNKTRKKKKIAFFHPFCSSGGGGERVLWKAIQALDELHAEGLEFEILVYTTDAASEKYTESAFYNINLAHASSTIQTFKLLTFCLFVTLRRSVSSCPVTVHYRSSEVFDANFCTSRRLFTLFQYVSLVVSLNLPVRYSKRIWSPTNPLVCIR